MEHLKFSDEFYSFVGGSQDPLTGAILVSRVIDEKARESWIKDELRRLASGFDAKAADAKGLSLYLRDLGFGGADDYFRRENSSLNYVLRKRRGIPISLALVFMGVGRLLGMEVDGINYPGHFLARVEGSLIDPFELNVLESNDSSISVRNHVVDRRKLTVASGREIVMRMFNNLRQIAGDEGDYSAALDYSGYQLILAEEPFPVYVERVSLWLAAGVKEMALYDLDKSISYAPSLEVRTKLEKHRKRIEASPSRLH